MRTGELPLRCGVPSCQVLAPGVACLSFGGFLWGAPRLALAIGPALQDQRLFLGCPGAPLSAWSPVLMGRQASGTA